MLRSGAKRSRCDLPKFRGTARNQARSTVANARKAADRTPPAGAAISQRRLAHSPKRVSDVEEAAEKAHIEPIALTQARGDLGVVTSRANHPGSALTVQWSLPG
jgi:hypothetical protein